MAQEQLIKWGKDAFDKGFSLAHIESYLLKRGMKQDEALKALHEITSFEHKIHKETEDTRKSLLNIPILLLLISSCLVLLYLAGLLKMK